MICDYLFMSAFFGQLKKIKLQNQMNKHYIFYKRTQQKLQLMEDLGGKTFASQFLQPILDMNQKPYDKQLLAIKNNRLDILNLIPSDIHALDPNNKNFLFYAAYQKQPTIFLYLLRRDLDTNLKDQEKKSLYHMCLYNGSLQCLQILRTFTKLKELIGVNQQFLNILTHYHFKRTDFKSGQLIFEVSQNRQKQFIKLQNQCTSLYQKYMIENMQFLQKRLAQKQEKNGRNPIHFGCLNRFQKCFMTLQYILEELALIQNWDLCNTQWFMSYMNQTDKYCQQLDPRNYQDTLYLLKQALIPKKLYEIHSRLKKKIRQILNKVLESKDKSQHTPMYLATKNGCVSIINLLLHYENQSRSQDENEEIVKIANHNLARSHIMDLCNASKIADIKTMSFLISCGEEVNKKKTIFGTFALLEAVKGQDNLQTIQLLLKSGADINQQDTNGWTILHHAAFMRKNNLLNYLVSKHKPDLNKRTNKCLHALHLAASSNNAQAIQILLKLQDQKCQRKIDIDISDSQKMTALHHAAKKGAQKALKKLIQYQANIYATDRLKMTALHHSALTNQAQCIKLLVYYDSDNQKLLKQKNSRGKVAKQLCSIPACKIAFENIFTAAKTGDINTIRKLLLANNQLKDYTTPIKKRTPLMLAVINAQPLVAKFLLQHQADTYAEDYQGKTAQVHAKQLLNKSKEQRDKQKYEIYQRILNAFPG